MVESTGTLGAIVLAGGRSLRMGSDKALLDWGGVPLVVHVSETLLATVDGPVVVVTAQGQELPALPGRVERTDDRVAGQGPLEGIRSGLAALEGRADLAFVSSVDAPHLRPELVRLLVEALGTADAAVPSVSGFTHPLSAVYRVSLLPVVTGLLETGERRARAIAEACRAIVLDETALLADTALRATDPELRSLTDLDTLEELAAARAAIPDG
jgi:molybdenum cofactor guanylyltransferase